MISLITILSEIKIVGKPTPNSVEETWDQFTQAAGSQSLVYINTVKFFKNKYGAADMGIKNFIRNHANEKQLKDMWVYLTKMIGLVNNDKLEEIKVVGRITPEMVAELWRDIEAKIYKISRETGKSYLNIRKLYGILKKYFNNDNAPYNREGNILHFTSTVPTDPELYKAFTKNLPTEELKSLYNELSSLQID